MALLGWAGLSEKRHAFFAGAAEKGSGKLWGLLAMRSELGRGRRHGRNTIPQTTIPQTTIPQTTIRQTTIPQTTTPQNDNSADQRGDIEPKPRVVILRRVAVSNCVP